MMNYLMHDNLKLTKKEEKLVRKYFTNIDVLEMELEFLGKKYSSIIDINSFASISNFDCFNCNNNCCVEFPYEYGDNTRKFILDNLDEYDKITKSISIMREGGIPDTEIINSIKNDKFLISDNVIEKELINRCTASCVIGNKKLCAIHKMCLDKGMSLEETIDMKPLWCSVYPIEIITDGDTMYIFVTNRDNKHISADDINFPCMDINIAKSAKFRRENPDGFLIDEYKPFILNYERVIKHIFGEVFYKTVIEKLELKSSDVVDEQYGKIFK